MNVFVFGSNLAGRHGKGSAQEAYINHGAKFGMGNGAWGNSYAIPTKDRDLKAMALHRIKLFVDEFLIYASNHPDRTFDVVSIGCGLAGYTPEQIAPMFRGHTPNVKLTPEFRKVLDHNLDS